MADAWAGLARIYSSQDNLLKAARHFKKAHEIAPENNDFNFDLCMTYMKLERYEEAQSGFEQVTEREPNNIEAWINLSSCVTSIVI